MMAGSERVRGDKFRIDSKSGNRLVWAHRRRDEVRIGVER